MIVERILPVALVFLGAILALGVSEGVVRVSGHAPDVVRLAPQMKESAYRLSDDPVLGYDLKPGFRSASPDCHHTFPFINSWGLRDRERVLERQLGRSRVILLGDSVVAGHGMRDTDKLISSRLEQRLGQDKWEVLNFGIGGYCTRAEVRLLQTRGVQFKPDLVVLLFVFNDFIGRNSDILAQLERPRPPALNALFLRSHLFRLTALRFDWFGFGREFGETPRQKFTDGGDTVAAALADFSTMARQEGFSPMIAMWPYFDDREIFEPTRTPHAMWSTRETEVERAARDHGIPTIRLSPEFQRDYEERKQRARPGQFVTPRWSYTKGDGAHASPLGAEIASTALAKEILAWSVHSTLP